VSHRPHKKNANHHSLQGLACKQLDFRLGAIDVDFDLFEVFDFVLGHVPDVVRKLFNCLGLAEFAEVVANQVRILFMFALKGALFQCLVYWDVVA